MRLLLSSICLFAFVSSDSAVAGELLGSDILVSARMPLSVDEAGVSVTVIDRAEIERLQAPLLLDVLRLQPGLSLSRNGGAGGFTAVRLRGAEGEHTTLVIDGVKVADPASPGGGVDFGTLASAGIGRVEILRGPQSLAWGSQAIGGVIAVETLAPDTGGMLSGRVEGGSHGHWAADATGGIALGPVALRLGGNWQRSDGISSFAEARGGAERDDFESHGVHARADVSLGGGFTADLRGRLQSSEFGMDGFPPPLYAFADTDDRSRVRDVSGAAGLRYAGGGVTARLGWQISDTFRRNFTPGADPFTSFRSEGRFERVDAQASWVLSDLLSISGGLEREVSRLETASPSAWDPEPAPFRARATLDGGFVQAIMRPVEAVTLSGGVRHDEHDRFGGATSLGASGSARIPGTPLRLKASYGEAFKAPTLFQLFSDYGNAALRPERAIGWDAGIALESEGFTASATWFERRTRNLIDYVSCFGLVSPICEGRPFGTYDNVLRAKARGLELVAEARPVEGLDVSAQYSWTDSRNRTAGSPNEGRRLARRPAHSLSATLDYAFRGFSIGTSVQLVSDSFDDAASSRPIPGHVLADIRAAAPLGKGIELFGRVTNLFDERYETTSFYGQPGREAAVGVRARF